MALSKAFSFQSDFRESTFSKLNFNMNRKAEIIFEILAHFFGISHFRYPKTGLGKVLSFGVLLFYICLLTISIKSAFDKVSKKSLVEIRNSYVQACILCCTILTSYLIFIVAWIYGDLECEIQKNLVEVDEICEDAWMKLKKKKNFLEILLQILSFSIFKFLPVVVCILLSFVEIILEKNTGLWRILFYPILLIKFSTYHYAWTVQNISERFTKINQGLEKLVKENKKFNFTYSKYSQFIQTQTFLFQLSLKIEKFVKSYEILFKTVQIFNKRFGILILMMVFANFLSIVFCGYNFFIELETKRVQIVIIGEFFFLILSLYFWIRKLSLVFSCFEILNCSFFKILFYLFSVLIVFCLYSENSAILVSFSIAFVAVCKSADCCVTQVKF